MIGLTVAQFIAGTIVTLALVAPAAYGLHRAVAANRRRAERARAYRARLQRVRRDQDAAAVPAYAPVRVLMHGNGTRLPR